LLVVEEGVWRDVDSEEVRVGDVVRGFFEWAFVWGDVDPHGGGLGAGETDCSTVVVEVRASALFESLDGHQPCSRLRAPCPRSRRLPPGIAALLDRALSTDRGRKRQRESATQRGRRKCEHNRERSRCKDCGGASI